MLVCRSYRAFFITSVYWFALSMSLATSISAQILQIDPGYQSPELDPTFLDITKEYQAMDSLSIALRNRFIVHEHEKPTYNHFLAYLAYAQTRKLENFLEHQTIKRILKRSGLKSNEVLEFAKKFELTLAQKTKVRRIQHGLDKLKKGRRFYRDLGKIDREAKLIPWKDGDDVLEIGSRDYAFGSRIAKYLKGGEIYLNEVDPIYLRGLQYALHFDRRLNKLNAKNQNSLQVVRGKETSTAVEDQHFDKIVIRKTFHHFSDPDKMLDSIKKSMSEKSRIYIIDGFKDDGIKMGCGLEITTTHLENIMANHGFVIVNQVQIKKGKDSFHRMYEYCLAGNPN